MLNQWPSKKTSRFKTLFFGHYKWKSSQKYSTPRHAEAKPRKSESNKETYRIKQKIEVRKWKKGNAAIFSKFLPMGHLMS